MSFYVLRFLLGVAEAGFFPGIIFYLGDWFPQKRARPRDRRWFMLAIPLASSSAARSRASCSRLDGRARARGLAVAVPASRACRPSCSASSSSGSMTGPKRRAGSPPRRTLAHAARSAPSRPRRAIATASALAPRSRIRRSGRSADPQPRAAVRQLRPHALDPADPQGLRRADRPRGRPRFGDAVRVRGRRHGPDRTSSDRTGERFVHLAIDALRGGRRLRRLGASSRRRCPRSSC